MPHKLQQVAGKHVSPLPGTLTEKLCHRHSPDQLAGGRLRPALPWAQLPCRLPSLAQCAQPTPLHLAYRAPIGWVQPLRGVCPYVAQLRSFRSASSAPPPTRWSEAHVGKAAAVADPAQVSSGQSQGAAIVARPEPRRPVRDRRPSPSANSSRAARLVYPRSDQWPRRLRCAVRWDPARPPATPLAMRFTSFAGGGESFIAACLIAAHCALIRAVSSPSVSTATSECISAAVCKFCGARVEHRVHPGGQRPGYPHVRSKQAGQCLPGCDMEQNQAAMQKQAVQDLRNLPSVARVPRVPCPWDSALLVLTNVGPALLLAPPWLSFSLEAGSSVWAVP